jgi:hypothetical protein
MKDFICSDELIICKKNILFIELVDIKIVFRLVGDIKLSIKYDSHQKALEEFSIIKRNINE